MECSPPTGHRARRASQNPGLQETFKVWQEKKDAVKETSNKQKKVSFLEDIGLVR